MSRNRRLSEAEDQYNSRRGPTTRSSSNREAANQSINPAGFDPPLSSTRLFAPPRRGNPYEISFIPSNDFVARIPPADVDLYQGPMTRRRVRQIEEEQYDLFKRNRFLHSSPERSQNQSSLNRTLNQISPNRSGIQSSPNTTLSQPSPNRTLSQSSPNTTLMSQSSTLYSQLEETRPDHLDSIRRRILRIYEVEDVYVPSDLNAPK